MWGSDSTYIFVFQIGFEYEKIKAELFSKQGLNFDCSFLLCIFSQLLLL